MELLRIKDADNFDAIVSYEPLEIASEASMHELDYFRILEKTCTQYFFEILAYFWHQHVNYVCVDFAVTGVGRELDEASVPVVAALVLVFEVYADYLTALDLFTHI